MAGLVKMLERSLSDPRRLRALLRFQAAVLTYLAMTGEPGKFAFERVTSLPPMFQAFPLQLSVPALVVDGLAVLRPGASMPMNGRSSSSPARSPRGGNPDRAGLAPAVIKIHTLSDGARTLGEVAQQAGLDLGEVVAIAAGPGAGRAGRAAGPDLLPLHPRHGRRPGDRPPDPRASSAPKERITS